MCSALLGVAPSSVRRGGTRVTLMRRWEQGTGLYGDLRIRSLPPDALAPAENRVRHARGRC
jgi:hypothetical protein